jgi:hypothetical protein
MPRDYAHTDDAEFRRLAKAYALADHLAGRGVTHAAAAALSPRGRRAAERLAGVRRCDDERTWPIVLARLAERER